MTRGSLLPYEAAAAKERLDGGGFFLRAPAAGLEKVLVGGPKSAAGLEPLLSAPLPPALCCLCAMIALCCSAISLLLSI